MLAEERRPSSSYNKAGYIDKCSYLPSVLNVPCGPIGAFQDHPVTCGAVRSCMSLQAVMTTLTLVTKSTKIVPCGNPTVFLCVTAG